ncbi:daunorubicin ABC transporter ATP-binding protein, partial [Candidatus Micrarchaeota archaeon CG_4_10_14_0_2_um_filter_49_7]
MEAFTYAIECTGLTKKFGNFTAVDSLELKVRKGEIFGFLGPNGAGKTTTIKMLTTLFSPTAGSARVASLSLIGDAPLIRAKIGVVPQEFALFVELTPMENLRYLGDLYGMPPEKTTKRSEELLNIVGLYDKKDVVCEGFSGGMKQRLSVAAGLLHTPDILFMDEPTTGLDPQSRIALRELTAKLNSTGITIVYTTHDMEEADKLCHMIAIMDKGKIIAQGTSEELKDKYGGGHRIVLKVDSHTPELLSDLKKLVNAAAVSVVDHTIDLRVSNLSGNLVHKLSAYLTQKRIAVHELNLREPSLEEVFINLTKKDLRE